MGTRSRRTPYRSGNQLGAAVVALLMVTSVFAAGFAGTAAAASGDVVYRVNAGGNTVSAIDSGPDWAGNLGQYSSTNLSTFSTADSITLSPSVPSGTPSSVFQTEAYGKDIQLAFSDNIQSGQSYEVRLYFAEIFQTAEGKRVFDVSVEGQTVLDNYDIYADVGHDTGVMKSFTVTPSDGTIDVSMSAVTDNAKLSAIEIVSAEPQPNELGGPSGVDFGQVVTGDEKTEQVTVTNLGGDGDPTIDISGASVTGTDAGEFSAGAPSQTTLAPGESAQISVTYSPSSVSTHDATLEVSHTGSNSPLTVSLSGEGVGSADPSFSKSTLQGFSAGNPTAIDFGPDGRAYVSTQGGTVYALNVTRTGDDSYQVENQIQIDAIKQIPNHDDNGNHNSGENNRQVTGLTAGGTASQPVVYVSSSDPSIDVGQDDDDTDTNSGTISRLTISSGSDGVLQSSEVDHDVMVLGLPRSEENHATNGLDLSADGDTLYVAQGGHTNKGAPGDNFGHTPEYALSAAILEIDLAQIEGMQPKNLQNYDSSYPNLDFYYSLPTIGDDTVLPFGGDDGMNQAKLVENGPVQIYSAGYRNPYDLVVAESGQIYAADHGPNGGWGGQPANASGAITADASDVTNHPNEDGSYSTSDQLVKVDAGDYGGHAAPIRANPTGADIYDANGEQIFDITESNSPVPASMVNPAEADYIPPTSGSPDPGAPAGSANTMETTNGNKVLFGPTGGTTQYVASNFGGAMDGDILQVELNGDIKRVELSSDGATVTNVETIANTGGPLGITAQDDDETFPGTVWTANHGGGDITILEPVDYGDSDGSDGSDGGDGDQCTGADDPSLDEDGDGYDNADELDAGTDPCSAASTPADFDGDGTSNFNDPNDDNDSLDDTEDPFAVDPSNGVDTTLPVQYDLSELSLFGESGQGWTGLMTNGQNYQDLYDTSTMTIGGAAEVLTVEEVPPGDAYASTNTQQYAFQFGADTPDQPFTVETTVASFPENPENYQSAGLQIGTGDQSNYIKLVAAADGGNGGIEFAKEVSDSFTHPTSPNVVSDSAVAGGDVTLRLTVDPTTDPAPNNGVDEVAVTAEYAVNGPTTQVGTAAMPASWLDTSDGVAPAVGVIATSNGASPFPATWTDFSVEYVDTPENTVPTADAGADQTVDEGTQVTLDGSGSSDADGDMLGYTWTQTGGSDVSLSVNDGETTTFTAPEVSSDETLSFQLNVSDGSASDTDTVNVTVQDTDAASGETYGVSTGEATNVQINTSTLTNASATVNGTLTLGDKSEATTYVKFWVEGQPGDTFWYTGDTMTSSGEFQFDVVLSPSTTYKWQTLSQSDDGEWKAGEVKRFTTPTGEYFGVTTNDATDVGVESATLNGEILNLGDNDNAQVYFTYWKQGQKDSTLTWYTGPVTDSTGPFSAEVGVEPNTTYEFRAFGQSDEGEWKAGPVKAFTTDQGQTYGVATEPATNVSAESATLNGNLTGLGDYDNATVYFQYWVESQKNSTLNWWTGSAQNSPGPFSADVSGLSPNTSYVVQAYAQSDAGKWTAGSEETFTTTEQSTATGSALVEITPDTAFETSTYGGGSYQVTNTGEKNITSVSFNLDTASLPDMVFDPAGTAGDPTGDGFTITSEGGTGITTAESGSEAFSQPHNGVNSSDGYDVMTVEFDDFQNGETATFWADNDPTSIKGATVNSQEAGPISGLELARSTVTVTYADGTTQTTQLMGDGSDGGATAVLDGSEAPEPTLGVQNVSLDAGVLDGYHSGATVSSADQTVTVTGQPGETVTLVRVEGELTLTNVPDADGDGEPGYEIEPYEANDAEDVEYYTATIGQDGTATIPVTLTNTTSDDDTGNAGYNYLVAAQGSASGDMGLASNVVVLKYEESSSGGDGGTGNAAPTADAGADQTVDENATVQLDASGSSDPDGDALNYQWTQTGGPSVTLSDATAEQPTFTAPDVDAETTLTFEVNVSDGQTSDTDTVSVTVQDTDAATESGSASFTVNENGGIDASTYGSGSMTVTNTGEKQITSVTYDLSQSTFPDVVFDPAGTAGDSGSKGFTPDSGAATTGLQGGSFAAPHNSVDSSDGYDELTATFGDFDSGETFAFSVDIDPTSIKDASGTGAAGSVSGLEMSGATVTVEYADGTTQTTSLFGDGSAGGSKATAKSDVPSAPTLGVQDVSLDSSALDSQHSAATVTDASQTITVSGPAGATVELLHVEGQLELANQADGYNLEEYEANTAENVDYQTVQLGSDGQTTVDVTLTNTSSSGVEGGFNHFIATVQDADGDTGAASNTVVLKYDQDAGASSPQTLHRVNAGESQTLSATDDGPDWTGVVTDPASSEYLASVGQSAGTFCGGSITSTTAAVPSSTPNGVYDCELYGNSTWTFDVTAGQEVEVRLYLGNQYAGADEPGERQYNVSIEGTQVLTNYDPVADVGHQTGTMKSFTVTDDGDGTITVSFETGAVENPQVNGIEIVAAS